MEDKAQYLLHLVGQLESRPWGNEEKTLVVYGVYRGLYQAVFSGIIISHY